jgi:Uma2 family endonuclease
MASVTVRTKPPRLELGPSDHGRPLSYEQFCHADYREGFHYELVRGRLYVVTAPRLPHDWLQQWLWKLLTAYSERNPRVINYLSNRAAVFVPGEEDETCPEPDIAAYQGFPLKRLPRVEWQDVSPILVIEVLSPDSLEKDLARNVELYLEVPSIREYWVMDGLANPAYPRMRAYRRHGGSWRIIEIEFGKTYETKLLPGFKLTLDPQAKL